MRRKSLVSFRKKRGSSMQNGTAIQISQKNYFCHEGSEYREARESRSEKRL